MKQKR